MIQANASYLDALAQSEPASALGQGNDPADLARCNSMEIRFPAATMPHGVLLVLEPDANRVVAASDNVRDWLGMDVEQVAAHGLEALFEPAFTDALTHPARAGGVHLGSFRLQREERWFDAFLHEASGWRVLELEPAEHGATGDAAGDANGLQILGKIQDYVEELRAASTPLGVAEAALRSIQALTGYDTVLHLSFLADGSFQAVAEVGNGRFPSFLDKRFPRSDIPDPARRKMLSLPMVYVPDISYEPVPLRQLAGGPDPASLDLGQARLRSLDHVCNRFYLNVGIKGKLVIPLVESGTQYGLVVCWSAEPRPISLASRLLARTVAELAGQLIREKKRAEDRGRMLESNKAISEFLKSLDMEEDFDQGLQRLPAFILKVMDACGAAYWSDQELVSAGIVPPREALPWVASLIDPAGNCHVSHREPELMTQTKAGQDRLAGVIVLPLLEDGQYLALFRREWEREVKWAGNPTKPVEIDTASGLHRLTACGSFETWKEDVRGQSRPWSGNDVEVLQNLRIGLTMLQARRLAQRSNEAKSRFMADISHEIRSPLNAVYGLTRKLRKGGGTDQDPHLFSRLESAVDHMLNVVNGVLDLAKIEAGKLQLEAIPFSLAEAVDTALRIVADQASEKGLALVVDLGKMPDRLLGDPTRLDQMLINYLVNAVKFTESGQVEVATELLEERDGRLFVRFAVTDTGKGLSPEQLSRLFAVFEQAGDHIVREHGGSGLGLVITRHLAQLMGGDAGVSSTPGLGSTFWFTCWLGRAAESAGAGQATDASGHAPASADATQESAKSRLQAVSTGKRVLLVEDEEINLMIGLDLLSDAGLEVVGAESAEQALEVLASAEFDLVLMDTNLPGMNGIDAAKAILANPKWQTLPIIAMTADVFEESRQACLAVGMRDFLGKPINTNKLYEMLLKWLTV